MKKITLELIEGVFYWVYSILVKGTHKKWAHGKLKVSDKAKDYYRVGVLKSGMHTAVLKEINSTCKCFSKEVILEEFEAYFEVLEREVFHEVFRWECAVWFEYNLLGCVESFLTLFKKLF